MQNEFEKQVQKKMEELDLVPSAPVWEKIEEQIRRKTDRRMVSLWVPLLFLLLGGGVWMLYDNQQSNGPRQNHQTAITNSNESKQIENKKQFPPENKIAPDKIQQKASVPFNIEPEKVSTAKGVKPHETSPDDDRTIASSSLPGTKNSSRKMLNINAKKLAAVPLAKQSRNDIYLNRSGPEKTGANKKPGKIEAGMPAAPVKTEGDQKKAAVASQEKKNPTEEKKNAVTPDSVAVVSVPAPKSSSQKRRSWNFGFTAAAGLAASSTGVGMFNGSGNAMMDVAGSSSSPRPPLINYSYVSPERSDVYTSLGLLARKQVGKKIYFNTGIVYDFFRTKTFVSAKVANTQVNGVGPAIANFTRAFVNTGVMLQDYYNVYHFLSIPVSIDYQPVSKVPLFIHGGLMLKQLIKTNALQFSDSSKVYYYDANAFNRTQIATTIGIEYTVINKKVLILAGPEFQYALSGVQKSEPDSRLYAVALRTRIFLQKK